MNHRIFIAAVLLSTLAVTGNVTGQQKQKFSRNNPMAVPFVKNEIADIVEATAGLYEEHYLDQTAGEKMARRLRKRLAAGAFDAITTRTEFAAALPRELRGVKHDKHIQIDFRYTPGSTPGDASSGHEPGQARMKGEKIPERSGIREIRLLEGGVACLRIAGFLESDLEAGLYDAAMRMVSGSNAVIVDLRGNGGGSSRAANELMTSLLGRNSLHIGTTRSRKGTREHWTEPRIDQVFVDEIPLVFLIDGVTASAAEAVVYHLKHLGRATVVGERSSGAANHSATIALEVWGDQDEVLIGSYTLILPNAQTVNSKSGRSWEGDGVLPDVATGRDNAMGEAHVRAIRAAHPSASWTETLVASVRAAYDPVKVTPADLERLAGKYEQGRSFHTVNGRFFTRNSAGDEMELIPVTATSFRYKSGVSATVNFDLRADGSVEAARIVFSDGTFERFTRLD